MIITEDNKLKFERIKHMPKLKQEIISYLFDYVARKRPGDWFKYVGEFKYDGVVYNLECECRMDNQMFTYRNLFIEHKQQIIDVDQLVRDGVLN